VGIIFHEGRSVFWSGRKRNRGIRLIDLLSSPVARDGTPCPVWLPKCFCAPQGSSCRKATSLPSNDFNDIELLHGRRSSGSPPGSSSTSVVCPRCSDRARGRTAQAESSSSLNEYSCSIFFRVSRAGRVETGASRRTDGEPGWFEGLPRYRANSSSVCRGSGTSCEGSTMIVIQVQGASSVDSHDSNLCAQPSERALGWFVFERDVVWDRQFHLGPPCGTAPDFESGANLLRPLVHACQAPVSLAP
jgi:hypothetical protein